MTDLHKGTHNCAAAIRESGASISYPSLAPPTPAFLHPRWREPTPGSPPSATPGGGFKGEWGGGTEARALSQYAAIIFPHEWAAASVVPGWYYRFYYSARRALALLFRAASTLSSFPLSLFLSSRFPAARTQDVCRCTIFLSHVSLSLSLSHAFSLWLTQAGRTKGFFEDRQLFGEFSRGCL